MKQKPRRGISMGTIVITAITAMVLIASAAIFPQLMGSADLDIDVGGVLSALTLEGDMPALALHEIPIAQATPIPTDAPPQSAATATPEPVVTPAPTATPVPGGKVTLTIGGSVNIDDGVRKSAYYSDSGKYDFTEILSLLEGEMTGDLSLVTLENLTVPEDKVSALNAPEAVMDMLRAAGVDAVALGFPKAYDKGYTGLVRTVEAAVARDLDVIGAYIDQEDADTLRLYTVNNVDVALLHYTSSVSSAGTKAIGQDGAYYALPEADIAQMTADIRRARDAGADVVIVSLNWGKVSASKPTNAQKELAQQLADAGADVIVGAGSRVVQPVTWLTAKQGDGTIRHTLCAWNLGSLLNDSRKDGNVAGMLLQLSIAFDGDSVSFERVSYTPTYIWRYKLDGQYQYRVAVADQTPPDGMGDDQTSYMEKALRNIQKYLDGSPITLRSK